MPSCRRELGLDSRALAAEGGLEGRYALRLGYSELPRHSRPAR
jgi:hypothetical protein